MARRLFSFKGGIHPQYNKFFSEKKSIEIASIPSLLYIPMQQHIGAPCKPLVKKGDRVFMGQKIGEPLGFVSAPIHSSVSGIVKAIQKLPHPVSGKETTVVIENDGKDEIAEDIKPYNFSNMTGEEIKEVIKNAGIVGMGGATFPTHVKLSPPPGKTIDTVIINGAECEPYLTADHRLLLEKTEDLLMGLKAVMKVLDVEKGCIGIEVNKQDAIDIVEKAVEDSDSDFHSDFDSDSNSDSDGADVRVYPLKTKYPQGAEKQLIKAIMGREVPSGGLPMDVGAVVINVGTACAIATAIKTGMPLIERVVTVTGMAVSKPKNLLVRVGTPFKDIIDQCGGTTHHIKKVISGGPMMGLAQYSLDVPVIKGTSGILLLNEKQAKTPQVSACIRCAKCIEACPVNLMPLTISALALRNDLEACEKNNLLDCIECGACSFVCPANRPLVESIRVAKRRIISNRRKAAQKKKAEGGSK